MIDMPPLALLAGGLATRLRPLTEAIPKSLIDVAGEPFIGRQLGLFRRQGIGRVVVCAGHLADKIEAYIGDGSRFGVSVAYSLDGDKKRGTGGALKKALPLLGDEFVVVYGDSWLDTNYAAVVAAFRASAKSAMMTLFRNENAWDASNVEFDGRTIVNYDKKNRTGAMHHIDWGMGLFRAEAFVPFAEYSEFDLADVYRHLLDARQLAGYEVKERFYEIGSHSGLAETSCLFGSPA